METTETIAGIVEEIGKETRGEDGIFYSMDGRKVMAYAHRFKRAASVLQGQIDHADTMLFCMRAELRRERPGNAAELRVALEAMLRRFDTFLVRWGSNTDCRVLDEAQYALKQAPRNCDRGREAAEDAFTAEFGRPWTEEEARVAEWLFEEEEGGETTKRRNDETKGAMEE